MKRLFLACLIFPVTAIADDPFACVDPEFAAAFLGTGYQHRPEYSTELPDAFDGLPVPDTFELVGSATNSYSLRAVYKTTEDSTVALSNVLNLLMNDGWRNLANVMAMQARGFQSGINPKMARVCRNIEPGLLTINVSDLTDQTYLSFSMANYGEGQTCDDLEAQSNAFGRHRMNLWNDLPVLDLPEDAQSSNAGSGGGGNEYHSDVVVMTETSRSSLVSHLGDQIRDQGWELDTSWSGALSSGSIWSRKSSEDEMLIGTLHAYGESPNTSHVRIGITVAKTGGFAGASRITKQAIQLN